MLGIENKHWITVSHIPGILYVEEDAAESRKHEVKTEWKLNSAIATDLVAC